MTNKLKRRKCR